MSMVTADYYFPDFGWLAHFLIGQRKTAGNAKYRIQNIRS